MQSITGKKKVRLLFQITKLLINQLGRCSTRSENVYFVNNEQALIVVFTAVFCFDIPNITQLDLNYIIIVIMASC